jgi:uncharacterized RDD family membrane protein YckC
MMRLLGIAIVREDGSDATRLRALWRAFVAWSPVILGLVGGALLAPVAGIGLTVGIFCTIAVNLTIWSLILPGRSLQDRLAGTWLVPR